MVGSAEKGGVYLLDIDSEHNSGSAESLAVDFHFSRPRKFSVKSIDISSRWVNMSTPETNTDHVSGRDLASKLRLTILLSL